MNIKIPSMFMGKPIKGAIDLVLKSRIPPRVRKQKKKEDPAGQAPDLSGFIYVPAINLYIAKERMLQGKNWLQTHRELHRQGLQMPTPYQFLQFVDYLKTNTTVPDRTQILDEILEKRDPWRAEWLDAKYFKKDGELWMAYNHRPGKNRRLQAGKKEKLEGGLLEDSYIDISSFNEQGLPLTKSSKQEVYYYSPVAGSVAWFVANSGRAVLYCYWSPTVVIDSLGVRAARAKI